MAEPEQPNGCRRWAILGLKWLVLVLVIAAVLAWYSQPEDDVLPAAKQEADPDRVAEDILQQITQELEPEPKPEPAPEPKPQPKPRPAPARERGNAHHETEGRMLCTRLIELSARYDYDWNAGLLGNRFPVKRWDGRRIVFAGNAIRFQNGFGAWQQMSYRCDYDTRTKAASIVYIR